MEEPITQVIEKNTVVRDWSSRTQKAKGDSLKEGYIPNLPERVTSNARQNDIEDLTRIWKQWDSDTRGILTEKYFWKVERTPFHMFSKNSLHWRHTLKKIGQRMSLNNIGSRVF
ncbi:hypothetical protein Gotur_022674 [Gossypium turneri]